MGEGGVPVKQRATSLQLLSATAPPAPPLPFPRCKCYGSSCWVVQATTRSAAAAARGSGWNSHGWRTRLGSKMDLRMPHLVDIAPFCSVVQAPSSPSSHGHANTVHHPVTVPMSFFGYGKAKVPDVVQVQSQKKSGYPCAFLMDPPPPP